LGVLCFIVGLLVKSAGVCVAVLDSTTEVLD